jgi:HD-GYP domain-containing protein (c-di-GMP phosphodiesterase class II)
MIAHLVRDDEFIKQNEHELTAFEVRTYTKILLGSINTMFVKELDAKKIRVLESIDSILENFEILCMLTKIRQLDDYTFEHSVNVSVLSIMCAILVGYEGDRLMDLAAGAILHDVGKTMVKEEILKKPAKLTKDEYEEIKLHTQYGYDLINSCRSLSKRAAYIANSHHERLDGKGYPFGISGKDISQEARIVAIADVYDALVSDRIYRSKMWPGEVLDYILTQESGYFDEEILQTFILFIAVFPVGTQVILSNNLKGIVIRDNFTIPFKPVVRIIDNDKFEQENLAKVLKTVDDISLDLSENPNIYISCALEIIS